MRHKEAWAEQATAPSQVESSSSVRRVASSPAEHRAATTENSADNETEILIVASKLKAYIKSRSDLNTSASVMERLSDMVRLLSDQAIDNARRDGRKTVMDRDYHFQTTP